MRWIREPRKRRSGLREAVEREEQQDAASILLEAIRSEANARKRIARQVQDLIALIEESLIEHGNSHTAACDKQEKLGAPCSCGFAALVKARKLASKIEA